MIYKGGILKAWGKKQAVAVHSAFFDTLPTLPTVAEADADMVWLVYDFVHDGQNNLYNQVLREKVYAKYNVIAPEGEEPFLGSTDETLFLRRLEGILDRVLAGCCGK